MLDMPRARARRLVVLAPALIGCGWWLGDAGEGDVVYGDSRCRVDAEGLHCARHVTTLYTGLSGVTPREVHWQVPVGDPPAAGWPAAILFQGTFVAAESFWDVPTSEVLGVYNQGLVTQALLDAGYAVITPEARLAGAGAWETNIPPMSLDWQHAGDHAFMLDIFAAIDDGEFGPLDGERLFAGGISSGGYMTSRVGLEYRARVRALAIASASYATCSGALCEVPSQSSEHPPTLFLHGSDDAVVPIDTMFDYRDALLDAGVVTDAIVAEGVGHGWIDAAPQAIVAWFDRHGGA
mgnify:CR=1 FL=1